MRGVFVAFALVLALGACGGDEPNKKAEPPGPTGFTPEAAPQTGASILLRGRSGDGERRTVDVVARGVAQGIHGMAFRLAWDPARVGFVAAHGGDVWSKQATLLAKEGLPGELVVVWTERGSGGGVSAGKEAVLGTIEFVVRTSDATDLVFRTDRSTVRDAIGAPVRVDWQGGQMAGR
ncbi:MAG: hypothetical protein K0S65_5034 [Labilithrix sp.]|nr:hypothetical protein [Labilithrix sp.]